jgi:hypothetical protein
MEDCWMLPLSARMLVFVLGLVAAAPAQAGSADTVNYQGLLTGANGSPLNGSVEIIARIWNAPTGGAIQWSELHSSVPVVDGVFSITLGEQNANLPGVLDGRDLWLEITVNTEPLTPRQPIRSVAHALSAIRVANGGVTAASIGEQCQVGQVLLQTANGWACGYAPQGPPGGGAVAVDATGAVLGFPISLLDPADPSGSGWERISVYNSALDAVLVIRKDGALLPWYPEIAGTPYASGWFIPWNRAFFGCAPDGCGLFVADGLPVELQTIRRAGGGQPCTALQRTAWCIRCVGSPTLRSPIRSPCRSRSKRLDGRRQVSPPAALAGC